MAVAKVGNKQKYELQLIVETFVILKKILEAKGGLALTEVCQCTHISKNKAFRILATLIQCGILEKDERSIYKIGITSIENAHRILARDSSLNKARLIMERLSKKICETVYFASYNGSEYVLVDLVDCSQPIKAASFVGAAITLPTVARGTTVAKIGEISVDTESLSPEITTVSMPYVNQLGVEIGALVVLAPTYRMTQHRIKTEIVPALRNAMQRPQSLQYDRLQENEVLVFLPSIREYAKSPHLPAGWSTDTARAERGFSPINSINL